MGLFALSCRGSSLTACFILLALALAVLVNVASTDTLPGGCDSPAACSFGGVCTELPGLPRQHTCTCHQPFLGADCSRFKLPPPIKIGGENITRSLTAGEWDYFVIQLPGYAPEYVNQTKITLRTDQGSCGYVLVDGDTQFFTEWHPHGFPHLPHATIYSSNTSFTVYTLLENVKLNQLSLSVVGLNSSIPGLPCTYSGSFSINTTMNTVCVHGRFDWGTCRCSHYWTGPNCDEFSFALIYTMALAAGTFMIGAIITSIMAGVVFRQTSPRSGPTSQGYERVN